MRTPWHSSIVTRLVVVYSLLTAAVIALLGWLGYRGSREFLLRTEEASLRHAAGSVRLKVQAAVGDLMRDAVQVSRSPTLREFVKNERGAEGPRWRGLVEEAFRATLEGKPSYFQVRLVGVGGAGMELVRLDNRDGFIVATPRERLQPKGDRDYFRDALAEPGGAVHLSRINLNRDFGRITEPRIPTLRAVKIIEDEAGTLHSLLVINMDLRPLLAEVGRLAGADARLALATGEGDYLLNADAAREFSGELGGAWNFRRDFAEEIPGDASEWHLTAHGGDLAMLARFSLVPGSPRELLAALTRPAESLDAGLREARNRALRYAGLAALGGIAIFVVLARLLATRLRRLTRAVGEYDIVRGMTGLPAAGGDEVGVLAAGFSELDGRVRDSLARMEGAVKAREDFLAVMSHEIRTPMNAVLGLVRALERNSPATHQAPILRSLGTAARNLMALLDDALDWSKLRAGKLELASAPFSLRDLLGDVALTHRPLAEQKGVQLELEIAPEAPSSVAGDGVRLGQVLHNLVSNAVKFTSSGAVTIRVAAEGGRVRFAVADSGIGIPSELLGRVFEPFDQTGLEIAQRFGGTGLGLSITRDLVALMGGDIAVMSEHGKGSVFSFALALEACAAPASVERASVPDLTGRRVLYVEDVASNREVMTHIFTGTRAELVMAETGAAGLERMAAEKFDIILLDVQLPDTSGPALAPKLRAIRDVPMLAVTAQATPAAREECLAAGMRGIVTKPIEPELFWREIARCLGGVSFVELEGVFSSDPAKLHGVMQTLATEFREYEKALADAFARDDIEALRKTRHKMHTAIEQLGLVELRASLERLVAGGDEGERRRCIELVAMARRAIEARAGEQSAVSSEQ